MPSIIFGLHAVHSLLKHQPESVIALHYDRKRQDRRLLELLELAAAQEVECIAANRDELNRMAEDGNHQGVVARASEASSHPALEELLDALQQPPFLLILDGVTDPHNLGACLRTADAAGVHAVIYPKDKSAGINSTVRKVACGAAETMPVYAVTNLARSMEELRERGIWITGTAGEATQLIHESDLCGPLALVMGAEGKGLRRLTREHCDFLAKIPMAGSVSSLNVSVATGICLFEAVRQRGSK